MTTGYTNQLVHTRQFSSVEEYVKELDGKVPIQRVLIANNGISAVKAIRSIRRWAYEMFADERKILFVAMATPEDLRANAEYIRMADQVVEVPGGANNNNYANVMLIVEIAERWQVDAVWAGWGHASENPILPETLAQTERKIIFIGPSGRPMRALGDKIGSTIIAQSAKVPTIAWNGDALTVDYQLHGTIPKETYEVANIKTVDQAIKECNRIGFPVMIKASEGGGGKGIRKVTRVEDVSASFTAVQGEIPGSPIFVMRLAPKSRHLEVQLLADEYGNAISLSGRDCSVQRRHQKIVEEGPVTAAPPHVWKKMEQAATRLAKEVNYSNAGTVEYLYTEEAVSSTDDRFFFLELNPRLQVEHPVTEMITGVNLPAAQLQVAMGLPLHRIPDIRRLYQKDPFDNTAIDFDTEEQAPPHGHVIAARITAENPDAGFQPTSGAIEELNFRSTPDVWGYFSVDSSGRVHEFADSQIGHLFAWGTTRNAARKNMILALKELSIRGDIRTTVEYLVTMMESEDFAGNMISTSWLDERIARKDEILAFSDKSDPLVIVLAGALCSAHQLQQQRKEEYMDQITRGQFPPGELLNQTDAIELIYKGIKYVLEAHRSGPMTFTICCNDSFIQADVRVLNDGGYLLIINGKSHVAYATKEASGLRLVLNGQTSLFTNEYDPTRLTASAAGKLARFLVPDGAQLKRGTPYAEVEVMKMYMPLLTPEAGQIHFVSQEGSILSPGDCIATMTLDDPSCVKKSVEYSGKLPSFTNTETSRSTKSVYKLKNAEITLNTVLDGYIVPQPVVDKAVSDLLLSLQDPILPSDELREQLSKLSGRIPGDLFDFISTHIKSYQNYIKKRLDVIGTGNSGPLEFDVKEIFNAIEKHASSDEKSQRDFETTILPLKEVLDRYQRGLLSRRYSCLSQLFSKYLTVEESFANRKNQEDIIMELRRLHGSEVEEIYNISRSHRALPSKNRLLLELLQDIHQLKSKSASSSLSPQDASNATNPMTIYIPILESIAKLQQKSYSLIALEARHLLIDQKILSYDQRLIHVEHTLRTALELDNPLKREEVLSQLIDQPQPIFDLLIALLQKSEDDAPLCQHILDLYVRRIYRSYHVESVVPSNNDFNHVQFEFRGTAPSESTFSVGMAHAESYDDLSTILNRKQKHRRPSSSSDNGNMSDSSDVMENSGLIPSDMLRHGVLASFSTIDEVFDHLETILKKLPITTTNAIIAEPVNVLHFAIYAESRTEEEILDAITTSLQQCKSLLHEYLIRRLTFAVRTEATTDSCTEYHYPGIYTFRQRMNYAEDQIVRHMEAPLAYTLELKRLSNYNVQSVHSKNKNIHLYIGTPKGGQKQSATISKKRIFVRAVVRHTESLENDMKLTSVYDAHPGPERMFVDALNALDLALADVHAENKYEFSNNHVFLSVLPEAVVDPQYIEGVIRILASRYADMLMRLRVSQVEFKINARFTNDAPRIPVRLVACNPTGFVLCVEAYVEAKDSISNNVIFTSIGDDGHGDLDGLPVTTPYPVAQSFDRHRELANKMSDTLYVYDFLEIFEHSLNRIWRRHLKLHAKGRLQSTIPMPRKVMEVKELVLNDDHTRLLEVTRLMGENTIGMVAWLITLYTPEFPEAVGGRQIVVIGNDITFKAGSFGTSEDKLFELASLYARERKLPRIYLAANAGARIGMSDILKEKYRVAWVDEQNPLKGFEYLYLTKEDYVELNSKYNTQNVVLATPRTVNNEERYVITDIIGAETDLGVENLRGSGTIAGETSRAYQDIFTLTYVCGRSVGIGAYLVRLGQRTIQKSTNSPIILTGFQALNKLMGRDVYTSNDQLGGIKIMHTNGVSHQTVTNHLDGVMSILKWLSFVPAVRSGPVPLIDITGVDMVERDIKFCPGKTPYDPRHLLNGCMDENGTWLSGFADRGSFVESLGGWAKSVVVGRARLGGIPIGIIVSEVRTAEKLTPADPATPSTQENLVQQAGQVWFPDSAHKTATAIQDFQGEDLPLMIFANWRGFSGGQRDMFDEVLKFGAGIVDGLVSYSQPVFVYIPPYAELRGGAWVVVDPTINADVMEMYADPNGRGGVLEPAGLIEIKYRKKDLIKTAHRLDHVLRKLDVELQSAVGDSAIAEIEDQIEARENALLVTYTQLATQFADLHDTPGRMKAKGCIREIVSWQRARSYFYWRLRRRLAEFELRRAIQAASGNLAFSETEEVLQLWFEDDAESGKTRPMTPAVASELWKDDRVVYSWFMDEKETITRNTSILNQQRISREVMLLGLQDSKAAVQGILDLIQNLNAADREEVVTTLRRGSIFVKGSTPSAMVGIAEYT